MKKHSKFVWLGLLLVLAMLFVACGGAADTDEEPGAVPGDETTTDEGEVEEETAEGGVVTVFGAFVDDEARLFEESIRVFEERTGIDVQYEGSSEFETLILVRDEAGDPPDVAALPQPGLMRDFAEKGSLVALPGEIVEQIEANYTPVWLDLGSSGGTPYGVFHRVNVKSLVWYPVPEFEEAGYEIPETWDELEALQQQIVDDGGTPWCVGIESGGATGWVATDWVEDLMLRLHGPDVYDQWVNHEIPFNDDRVREAVETMGEIWLDPDLAYGGTSYILTTPMGDSPNPMFDDPPGCWLHRQGNFITGFFPDEVQADLASHVGVFGFPAINPEYGIPMLGGGDQFVMFEDRPEVRRFMEFLATGESGEAWARAGGAVFPHQDLSLDTYGNEIERQIAELLQEAEVFRFDGSDNMPGAVGAGSFWTGMVDYISGSDLDSVLQNIEDSWPAGEE
ncbi:MAG TPA: ABC transporter substrate-binding protein [Candidatus Sulfomarinibacteraceae bacterium]|nr:ABC transporter substrate-binding protein [Candidatus Sulfomarinibacteraceae bacterium]